MYFTCNLYYQLLYVVIKILKKNIKNELILTIIYILNIESYTSQMVEIFQLLQMGFIWHY